MLKIYTPAYRDKLLFTQMRKWIIHRVLLYFFALLAFLASMICLGIFGIGFPPTFTKIDGKVIGYELSSKNDCTHGDLVITYQSDNNTYTCSFYTKIYNCYPNQQSIVMKQMKTNYPVNSIVTDVYFINNDNQDCTITPEAIKNQYDKDAGRKSGAIMLLSLLPVIFFFAGCPCNKENDCYKRDVFDIETG